MSDVNTDMAVILEALNDKTDRDFNNMDPSTLSKETIVGWGDVDYSSAVSVSSFPYTALSDGVIMFYGACNAGQYFTLKVNDVEVGRVCGTQTTGNTSSASIRVSKNDIFSYTYSNNDASRTCYFYPLKGV